MTCPHCNDRGWYVEYGNSPAGVEQVVCDYCDIAHVLLPPQAASEAGLRLLTHEPVKLEMPASHISDRLYEPTVEDMVRAYQLQLLVQLRFGQPPLEWTPEQITASKRYMVKPKPERKEVDKNTDL